MSEFHFNRIVNSALWAAYGDALGFMTELTNKSGLKHRTGLEYITTTQNWKRRIGGKFGAIVELPQGSYSDDTQLRLSTSRAIRSDGEFDVEVFAKIELPVWTTYSLGAGRGSKAAVSSLAKKDINWFSNFFSTNQSTYINGGGNGAAMRIQPHVWSCDNFDSDAYLIDVFKNSICTHGHARGIVGALFHAKCLAYSLTKGTASGPTEWYQFLDQIQSISASILSDSTINDFWLPHWESLTKDSFASQVSIASFEIATDIGIINNLCELKLTPQNYKELVSQVGASDEKQRGSGSKTALISAAIAWLYKDYDTHDVMATVVNFLESDTDTIATMYGAIIGCICPEQPRGIIQDFEYIVREAERMASISIGKNATSFSYPEVFSWKPPKSLTSAFGLKGDNLAVAGLSEGTLIGSEYTSNTKQDFKWQWFKLNFGQTVLIKRKETLSKLAADNYPVAPNKTHEIKQKLHQLFQEVPLKNDLNITSSVSKKTELRTINEMTDEVISTNFNTDILGKAFLELIDGSNSIESTIAFAAIIAKARLSRKLKAHKK